MSDEYAELVRKIDKLKTENRRLKGRVSSLEADLFRVKRELDKCKGEKNNDIPKH